MTESITERVPILNAVRKKKKEDALARYFLDQFNTCKSERAAQERQWALNYAFVSGRQNVQVIKSTTSTTNYRLFVPQSPPWRVRLIINRTRQIVRKELAKTTSSKPIFTVVPETTEDEDIVAARAAEQIFMAAYGAKEIQTVLTQTAFWRSITGVGYIKTWWDRNAIDPVSNQMGDICIERVRPFNIIVPDLMEEDIEKQPWIIHCWTMSPEDAQNRYALDKLPQGTISAASDIMEESILSLSGGGQTSRKEVLVLEVWIKPNRHPDYPKGGLVTIVSDQLVQNLEEYPYVHGEFPIAKLDHIPTGKYYSEATVTDLIAPQRELNRSRSQLIEDKNLTARPRYFADRGSLDVAKISGEPGQVIFTMPGLNPPRLVETPQQPAYVMQMLDQLLVDMDDISGQHEISRGGTPNSQVTAATAISFLQEQDDSILAPTIESQEAAIRKIGRQYLALAGQYWSGERTIKVTGENGYFDALTFKKENLMSTTGQVAKDVRVEAGSSLSFSKAARQAVIMDLIKNGIIDPATGLKRMEFGGVEKLYEEIEIDRRQATRENLRMAQVQPIAPHEFDNHEIHVEMHNKFRKSQQYDLLDQQAKMIFNAHVQLHNMAQMAQAQQMMQMQRDMSQPLAPPNPVGNTGGAPQVQPPLGST